MLLRGFESCLGLESSGCSMWHFLKLVARAFNNNNNNDDFISIELFHVKHAQLR